MQTADCRTVETMRTLSNVKNIIPNVARKAATDIIKPFISESKYSHYSSEDISEMLIAAALLNQSLETTAKEPIGDTIFLRITRNYKKPRKVIRKNRPKIDGVVDIAIDVHDEMYHGKKKRGIVGTKPKNGSHNAFKFLAVRIVSGEKQYLVDVIPLLEKSVTQPTIDAIKELLKEYRIRYVLMDGEFYSYNLLVYLDRMGMIYICRRKNSVSLTREKYPYNKAILYLINTNKEKKQKKCFVYRFHGRKTDFYLASNIMAKAKEIKKLFKIRWRIETAFREVNRFQIKTCTRSRFIRILFYVIACLLYNLWIGIRGLAKRAIIRMNDLKHALLEFIMCNSPKIRIFGIGLGSR